MAAEENAKKEKAQGPGKGAYTGSNSYRSTSSSRYAPYPPHPFPGSNETRSKPRCVGCGKTGHKLQEHRQGEHGSLLFATSTSQGDLVGPNGAKICIWYNINGECKHPTCSANNRICSLCGGRHYALGKAICPNRPRD